MYRNIKQILYLQPLHQKLLCTILTLGLNFVTNNGNFYNSRKCQIIENKESGKMFETLPTQCQPSSNRVNVESASTSEYSSIPRMDIITLITA